MALRKIIAPLARRDLKETCDFIASEDRAAALRVVERIQKAIDLLASRPFIGAEVRVPLSVPLRKMSVPPFIIFYRATEAELLIVRILHSSRDLSDPSLYEAK